MARAVRGEMNSLGEAESVDPWGRTVVGLDPCAPNGRPPKDGSDAKTTERAVVSVKGGEHVGVPMVRDLKGVLEREKAPIGVFLTLTEPTKPMIAEAASAGFYELGGRKYPRLQIITIEKRCMAKSRQSLWSTPVPRSRKRRLKRRHKGS